MAQTLNSFKMAEIMYKILKAKGEVTLEDILAQFEVSVSTAYNIQRALKMICERHPDECEIEVRNRRTVFKYIPPAQQEPPAGQQAEQESKQQGRSLDEISPEELLDQAKPVKMLPDVADRKGTVIVKTDEEGAEPQ